MKYHLATKEQGKTGGIFVVMLNRERFRTLRERFGSREKFAGAIGMSDTAIQNWETKDVSPDLNSLIKAAKLLGTTVAYLIGETNDPAPAALRSVVPRASPQIDTSEFEGVLSKEKIESIVNAPFRASINTEMAKDMSDEEILMALQETQKRIILYELRDELKKELERRSK